MFFTTIRGRTLADNPVWLSPWLVWGLLVLSASEFDALDALYDGRPSRGVELAIIVAAFIWATLTIVGSTLAEHLGSANTFVLLIVAGCVVAAALVASRTANVSAAHAISIAAFIAILVLVISTQWVAHRHAQAIVRRNQQAESIRAKLEEIAALPTEQQGARLVSLLKGLSDDVERLTTELRNALLDELHDTSSDA